MHTNTHVPPGGTVGERLLAPRQALAPHHRFETLARCPMHSHFAPPPFCAYPGRRSPYRAECPFFCSGFSLELCVSWISCSTIPADICYLPEKQFFEDHGAGEPTSIATQISAPIGCADDGLDGSALSVSASFDVAGHLALYGNGNLARLGAGRGLTLVGL